jgi:hypothetical protein
VPLALHEHLLAVTPILQMGTQTITASYLFELRTASCALLPAPVGSRRMQLAARHFHMHVEPPGWAECGVIYDLQSGHRFGLTPNMGVSERPVPANGLHVDEKLVLGEVSRSDPEPNMK